MKQTFFESYSEIYTKIITFEVCLLTQLSEGVNNYTEYNIQQNNVDQQVKRHIHEHLNVKLLPYTLIGVIENCSPKPGESLNLNVIYLRN